MRMAMTTAMAARTSSHCRVHFRRRGTMHGLNLRCCALAWIFQASSGRSLAAGRVAGEEAASRGFFFPSGNGWRRTLTVLERALVQHVAWERSSDTVSSRFFDGRHWKHPPAHLGDVDVQYLIFKILSGMGCAAKEHLFVPREQFPTNLLLLLEDTDFGEVLARWKPKKCGLFNAAYIAKCIVAGFDDSGAKFVLHQVAQSKKIDTADIELRHVFSCDGC